MVAGATAAKGRTGRAGQSLTTSILRDNSSDVLEAAHASTQLFPAISHLLGA